MSARMERLCPSIKVAICVLVMPCAPMKIITVFIFQLGHLSSVTFKYHIQLEKVEMKCPDFREIH